MEDEAIYELYFQRNEDAIIKTHEKYGAWCGGVAMRILNRREDAEECLADTYLRTWNNIPPQKPRSFCAWLGRLTRNLALSRYRNYTAEKRGGGQTALALEELSECVSGTERAEDGLEAKTVTEAINKFLAELPENHRMIFLRRYWHMASIAEIAKAYGLTEGQVTSSLFRSRKKLKALLLQEGIGL